MTEDQKDKNLEYLLKHSNPKVRKCGKEIQQALVDLERMTKSFNNPHREPDQALESEEN